MIPRHFLSFTLIGLLSGALGACSDSVPPDPRLQTPTVRIDVVRAADPAKRVFTGVVAARVQSDLGFRVSGKVLERLVDSGQSVKRGQPLMRIDANDLKLAARAQQQAVLAAMARARQAADDELRYRKLVSVGAVSDSAYAGFKATADSAKAQLNAAQAEADVATNALSYSTLLADADGVVIDTLAEPGQVVSAGQVVVRVAHSGQREAVIQLPETLRPALGSPATVERYGQSGSGGRAHLRQLADSADRQTRTFEARYVLDGALASATLGSTITVAIAESPAADSDEVQVPIASLHDAGKGPGVWVVAGDPGRVTWRPVTIQALNDAETARVTGALQAGERLVALGAHLLSEGQQVRTESDVGLRPPVAEVVQ